MQRYYWEINDGRIWGLAEAGWVVESDIPAGFAKQHLYDGGRPADLECLRETIRYYGGSLGGLAEISDLNPGPDYDLAGDRWVRHRFSKLAFFSLFTMAEKVTFKTVIAGGNMVAGVIHDSLTMADYIDVTDPATVEALYGLASEAGGQVITQARAAEILAGVEYVHESGVE